MYQATDTRLKRPVAIKILPHSVAADAIGDRFQREAEGRVAEPSNIAIYGWKSGARRPSSWNWSRGEASAIIARGPIHVAGRCDVEQIAEALEAAHGHPSSIAI